MASPFVPSAEQWLQVCGSRVSDYRAPFRAHPLRLPGMEQDEPALMFSAAGLRREFALRWVDALRRLLLACVRQRAQKEPLRGRSLQR